MSFTESKTQIYRYKLITRKVNAAKLNSFNLCAHIFEDSELYVKLDKFGWHTERQSCTIIYTSASVSASLYQHIQAKTFCVGSWACSFQINKHMNFHVCRQLVYYAFSLSLSPSHWTCYNFNYYYNCVKCI